MNNCEMSRGQSARDRGADMRAPGSLESITREKTVANKPQQLQSGDNDAGARLTVFTGKPLPNEASWQHPICML
jgi:hypothetical protein